MSPADIEPMPDHILELWDEMAEVFDPLSDAEVLQFCKSGLDQTLDSFFQTHGQFGRSATEAELEEWETKFETWGQLYDVEMWRRRHRGEEMAAPWRRFRENLEEERNRERERTSPGTRRARTQTHEVQQPSAETAGGGDGEGH